MKGETVSFIDDDESLRSAVVRLLRSMGFCAESFASAHEYLSLRRADDTLCLIADVEMPGMGGIELQEHLITLGYETPIIFITAFPEDQLRDRAMRAGAVDLLAKPFDETRLLACIQRALLRKRSASDNRRS